ncbi:alpha/beta hydrolase [Streptacidiphilus melanogenes]|uniref:alpha/beta hydrolase n=1 Tax=Streptacidiphilus melanogenes TaxID=411235 RepID=UPI0005A8A209|nr:alpha/beta hydrolase [Streptacidiphilus melanogenes]
MNKHAARRPELSPHEASGPVRGVALLLPGGSVSSHRRPLRFVEWTLGPLVSRLLDADGEAGLAVRTLRYRYRGWNGEEASTLADTLWALEELRRRYGDVPVCLVGNSLGGRAAFRAAGHESVVGVCGVAPWLPPDEPVEQLASRRVLIVHGDRDHSEASAAKSLAYAERARAVAPVARLEVAGANHFLMRRAADFWSVTAEFVHDTLAGREPSPLLAHALAAPDGLRAPLPVGYGGRR